MSDVVGLVGVYHADGGLRGELTYVLGRLLGSTHCALCDITHGLIRRKHAWDAMVTRLGVPFELVHRNHVPLDLAALVDTSGTPVVASRHRDGSVRLLLEPAQLELSGSIEAAEEAITTALGAAPPDRRRRER